MNTRVSDILLGLVFFGALIGLGVATILLSDFRFGVERYEVELISPDVGYLRPGDPSLARSSTITLEPRVPYRRRDAAHRMQTLAAGLASSRSAPIGVPQASHMPYVPASTLFKAASISSR